MLLKFPQPALTGTCQNFDGWEIERMARTMRAVATFAVEVMMLISCVRKSRRRE
jgi:hypothetical protein